MKLCESPVVLVTLVVLLWFTAVSPAAAFNLLHVSFVHSAKWVQRMSYFDVRFAQPPHFEWNFVLFNF